MTNLGVIRATAVAGYVLAAALIIGPMPFWLLPGLTGGPPGDVSPGFGGYYLVLQGWARLSAAITIAFGVWTLLLARGLSRLEADVFDRVERAATAYLGWLVFSIVAQQLLQVGGQLVTGPAPGPPASGLEHVGSFLYSLGRAVVFAAPSALLASVAIGLVRRPGLRAAYDAVRAQSEPPSASAMKEALPVLSAGAMVWAAILLARAGVHLRLLLKSGATDAGTSGVDVTVSVAGANAVSIGLSAAAALSLAAAGALCKRAHPLGLQAARGAACVAVAAAAAQWFELIPAMFISLAGLAAAASVLPSAAAAITPPTLAFVLTRTDSVRDAYARVAGEEAGRPAGWEQA